MKDTNVRTPWLRLLALLMGLVLVAAACGGDDDGTASDEGGTDDTTSTTAEPEGTPVKGGSIVFGTESDVSTLDVGAAAQPADKVITLGIYDPLTTYVDDEVVPYLAETLDHPEGDLATWNMTLREGVKFHDGTPLNAEAVVKHFDRMKDPATACPCMTTASIVESMETPDGPTGLAVTFHLATPTVAFADTLAGSTGYIESPTAVAKHGKDYKLHPVGTGPFKLKEFVQNDRVVLEAYADYWQTDDNGIKLPYLDQITFKPIPDAGQRLTALQTGDVDMIQTAVSSDIDKAKDGGFEAQTSEGSSSTILLFNLSKPPFDNVKARQAVAYAIDKDLMNERLYEGSRVPSYSGFALDSPFYKEGVATPKFDRDKAKALVEELGGLKFSIDCISTPESDTLLEFIKQMGEAAGMEIELKFQDQGAYVQRMFTKGGDYEAGCFRSTHFLEPDAIRAGLTTDDASNLVFYSNPEVDSLFDQARQTDDLDERKDLYGQIQELTAADIPVLTMLYDRFGNIYDPEKVGPPPPSEANSLGALKPGFLYTAGG